MTLTIKITEATENELSVAYVFDEDKLLITAWPIYYWHPKDVQLFVLSIKDHTGTYLIDLSGSRWEYELNGDLIQVGATGRDAPLLDMLMEAGFHIPRLS